MVVRIAYFVYATPTNLKRAGSELTRMLLHVWVRSITRSVFDSVNKPTINQALTSDQQALLAHIKF